MASTTLAAKPMDRLVPWAPVILALLAMYVPTVIDLFHGLWQTDEQAHGPLIVAVCLYFAWQQRHAAFGGEPAPRRVLGGVLVVAGLLSYVIGRSQSVPLLEVGSVIPVVAGVLLYVEGLAALRAMWFPVVFLFFVVPLPNFIIEVATQPLKQWVSVIAEEALYAVGYPISRTGVTLTIGQYQLLVADACSGLNSIFSLSAMGLLYLYIMQYKSWWRNAIILLATLPIAFVANIGRVMALVLITYHLGDEAGQGFLHGFSGMVLFVIALMLLFGFDALLGLFFRSRRTETAR